MKSPVMSSGSVYLTLLVVTTSLFLTADALKWVSCKGVDTKGTVKSVNVVGCESTPTCVLVKGKNASFEIDFTINEDSKGATSVVHGYIAGIPVPFHIDNPDACKDSDVTCPLTSGTAYTYKTKIFVKTEYPSIKLKVRWEIEDDNGKDIVCIELPAQISSGGGGVASVDSSSGGAADNRLLFAAGRRRHL